MKRKWLLFRAWLNRREWSHLVVERGFCSITLLSDQNLNNSKRTRDWGLSRNRSSIHIRDVANSRGVSGEFFRKRN